LVNGGSEVWTAAGKSWGAVIEKWPCLEHVIADGGQGHERGVKWANEARREAQEPETDSPAAITMGLTPVAYGLSKIEISLNLPCCKSFGYSNLFKVTNLICIW
jgi:hypothetical protein